MYATATSRWRTGGNGSGGWTGWPCSPGACDSTSTRRSCGDCASRSTSPAPIPIPNDGPTTPTALRVAVDGRASVAGLALDAHGRGVHRDRGQLAGGGGVQRFLEIDPCLALAVAFLAHDHRLAPDANPGLLRGAGGAGDADQHVEFPARGFGRLGVGGLAAGGARLSSEGRA